MIRSTNLSASIAAVYTQPLPAKTLATQPFPPKPMSPMEVFANVKAALSANPLTVGPSTRLDAALIGLYSPAEQAFIGKLLGHGQTLDNPKAEAGSGGGLIYTGPAGPPTGPDPGPEPRPPHISTHTKPTPPTPPPPPKPVFTNAFFSTPRLLGGIGGRLSILS